MSEAPIRPPLAEGDLLAAVDIGSNSFHMLVARYVLGQLRVIDRVREPVRLAGGLTADRHLEPRVLRRAMGCLERIGQRLRAVPPAATRAVATNTVRQLDEPRIFLDAAEAALGHPIEVVSGREEARLIYLGVAHGSPPTQAQRLVIDIGGGSTEFIIGRGFDPLERESLQMGCVATTRRFFPDGELNRAGWQKAQTKMLAEFQQFAPTYRAVGWQEVIGSSGTNKAIARILARARWSDGSITAAGLGKLRDRMLAAGSIERLDLPGLAADRRPVIAGGLLVLETCFQALGIESMAVSPVALREGILYDLLGRAHDRDPRDLSIAALAERYGIDMAQADRVEQTARQLFAQVRESWRLDDEAARMLQWAARIHEIGLAIAHSLHHQHGAYLIEHSDIAGFSKQEQQMLATLVRLQRRGVVESAIAALPERSRHRARQLTALLRLAVLLHRAHEAENLPPMGLAAKGSGLILTAPGKWLAGRPLTKADLDTERKQLAKLDFELRVEAA